MPHVGSPRHALPFRAGGPDCAFGNDEMRAVLTLPFSLSALGRLADEVSIGGAPFWDCGGLKSARACCWADTHQGQMLDGSADVVGGWVL
jgi:hypothetical protein